MNDVSKSLIKESVLMESKTRRGERLRSPKIMKMRKNIRLKNYDYSTNGLYFITICTKDMYPYFGNILNNKMVYNEYGLVINDIFQSFVSKKYSIDFYQIMPNHIHCIIELFDTGLIVLSNVISILKSRCSFILKNKKLWQKGYYERIIRDEKEYNSIVKYIINNPYESKKSWK